MRAFNAAAALLVGLFLAGCASGGPHRGYDLRNPAYQSPARSVRPVAEDSRARNWNNGWDRRTGTIWLAGQPCQAITTEELAQGGDALANARRALDICARALQTRVIERLDGRGDLAAVSSIGVLGGVVSGGAVTTNFWTGVATIPVYYEGLQSSRMTAIEFFSGYGVSWIRERSNELDSRFETLAGRRAALLETMERAERAIHEIGQQLECANAEPSIPTNLRARCSSFSATNATTRTETRTQLANLIGDIQAAQSQARRTLNALNAVLARRDELPTWMAGRFEYLRYIAFGQQISSRVGPEDAFRHLLAAPFAAVANTLNGVNAGDLPRLQIERALGRSLADLRRPMGISPSTVEINATIRFDRTKISNTARAAIVAARVADAEEMIDAARAAHNAIAALAAIDEAPLVMIELPG